MKQTVLQNCSHLSSNTKTLTTVQRDKQWCVAYDKRVIEPNSFSTLPYGYHWSHAGSNMLLDHDEDSLTSPNDCPSTLTLPLCAFIEL